MKTLVITGGIATGKSSFCQSWKILEPQSVIHDADACVHALYANPEVRALLSRLFGPEVLVGEAEVDRSQIRRAIVKDRERKKALEEILHPRVRQARAQLMESAQTSGAPWFLAEIPLFFEAGAVKPVPSARVVVVACSADSQRARLRQRNPFDNDEAGRIIGMQASLSEKMAAADHVLWNEGQPPAILRQIALLRDGFLRRSQPASHV